MAEIPSFPPWQWQVVPYDTALPSLMASYLDHVRDLRPDRDFREVGQGANGHLEWLDQQMADLLSTDAAEPFGIYIITRRLTENAEPQYAGACAIVKDDRNVARDHNIPGNGFWAGTIGLPEALEAGLWLFSVAFRDGLCRAFADAQGRPARFNAITTSTELALLQVDGFDAVDSGQTFDVPVLGKVRLLYKEYTPQS